MIEYFDNLDDMEKEIVTSLIKTLYGQTYILERRYDRKSKRLKINLEYRSCEKHFAFLKKYFQIAGIDIFMNVRDGIVGLKGYGAIAERTSLLTTKYILSLKIIFDDKMSSASSSSQVFTSLREIHEKLSVFHLSDNKLPSVSEIKKTLSFLKKYQLIDFAEDFEESQMDTILLIYPTINVLIDSDMVMKLMEKYEVEE